MDVHGLFLEIWFWTFSQIFHCDRFLYDKKYVVLLLFGSMFLVLFTKTKYENATKILYMKTYFLASIIFNVFYAHRIQYVLCFNFCSDNLDVCFYRTLSASKYGNPNAHGKITDIAAV